LTIISGELNLKSKSNFIYKLFSTNKLCILFECLLCFWFGNVGEGISGFGKNDLWRMVQRGWAMSGMEEERDTHQKDNRQIGSASDRQLHLKPYAIKAISMTLV
jgi:hypothetical protein